MELAEACFGFLPARAELDLAGWAERHFRSLMPPRRCLRGRNRLFSALDRSGRIPIIRFEALGTIFAYGAALASANGLDARLATDRRCRSQNRRPLPQKPARKPISGARAACCAMPGGAGCPPGQLDGAFCEARAISCCGARAGGRHRHGQERPCRRARSPRPSPRPARPPMFVHPGRGQPRRSRHDHAAPMRVLALSNSGETAELADLIAYAKRFGIPLIGITGRGAVALARRRRRGAGPAARRGGLPDGPRAHHLDHDDAGARRRARGGAAGAQRLLRRAISAFCIPAAGSAARCMPRLRHHAQRRRDAAGAGRHRDARGRS